jgi:hypothetical protein
MSSPKSVPFRPVQFPYEEFEKLAKRIVMARFPSAPHWDEETTERHIRHLVIAYQLHPELLVEDAVSLLDKTQNCGFF